jgi:tRNA(adenine34) deaminase
VSFEFESLDHGKFMREALREAATALQQEERPIGAVIVHQGKIVGRGRAQHRKRQSEIAHAELNALIQAERYLGEHPHECVLYSTLEPCVMCLGASVMSDIAAVVFAMPDGFIKPSEMMALEYVKRHIQHYVGGILENECEALWVHSYPEELRRLRTGHK